MRWIRSVALAGVVGVAGVGCNSSTSSGGVTPGTDGGSDAPSGDAGPAACPAPTGSGTTHATRITADETWTAAGSPHIVPADLTISAKVTVEPCAEVRIAAAKQLAVAPGGSVVAHGTASQPIHFTAQDPSAPFASLSGSGGTLDLAYVSIDGGGDPGNTIVDDAGMIDLQGADNSKPTQGKLLVDHVSLSGSKSNGVVLRDGAGFVAGSTALTVTHSAQYPVSIWSRAVGTLPGGAYTGNGTDEILLPATGGNEAIKESATMHAVGVPYRVGNSTSRGTLYVAGDSAGLATLTIDAGVTLRFVKNGVLYVEPSTGTNPATGALVARGTASSPITFTSAAATPAAGDWYGVYFGQVPDASDAMDYTTVSYAGGTSSVGGGACPYPTGTLDAAIRIFGVPTSAFVTHTTIASSKMHGIDRGYEDDIKLDFTPTNTFTNVIGCKQTYPKDTNGACPATVPCMM
jgi:hypothetical protein